MPRYDFECQVCHAAFEIQASLSQYMNLMKEKKIECVKCGSTKVARVFSPPGLSSSSNRGGGCCPGGQCGCG
ncbi:MAG: zinc ribbon domain-containing protein [Kiritimatiellae bacterium]|nr:zinc ribbon domain-containing protein [Kiritimatiellia bacterium]MDD5519552.1 zinc ribbon domain-containing protein [Kiritimatiellia bacterium]